MATAAQRLPAFSFCSASVRVLSAIRNSGFHFPAKKITINLAPYGNMTFATDALNDMLACAYVCDVEIRGNPALRDAMVDLPLIDHSTVSVKCIHALAIAKEFCKTHRARNIALHNKLRAAALATTIEQVTSI